MTKMTIVSHNNDINYGEPLQHCTNNRENMASPPGDPGVKPCVKLHPEDVKGLIDKGYLRMNLPDFILHSICMYSSDKRDINYCLDGTVTRQWLECMVMPIRGPKKQEKFEKLCKQLEDFDKGKHQIIVPDIGKSHYSVLDIMIDNESPNYIMKVLSYDSLMWKTMRSRTRRSTPV